MRRSFRGGRNSRGNSRGRDRGRNINAERNRSYSNVRVGQQNSEEWSESRITDIVRRALAEALGGSLAPPPPHQQPASSHTVTVNPEARADGINYQHQRSGQPQTTSNRSTNPDFAKLVRGSFTYVKIAHAADNWRTLPVSLNKAITRLADNIKPPSPSEEFHQQLTRATDNFRSAVTAAVQQHLEKAAVSVVGDLQRLSQLDRRMAHDTVRRQLNRQCNKRIQKSTIDRALGELASQPIHTSTSPDFPPLPRPPPHNSPPSPSRTPASMDTSAAEESDDELDELVDVVVREQATTAVPETPGKRRLESTSPTVMPPAKSATSEIRSGPSTKADRTGPLVLAPENKDWWALPASLPTTARMLVITDSNGARWKTPDHIFVVALRGGRISDATRLLQSYRLPPTVKHIVIALGTNNRRDRVETMTAETTQLQATLSNLQCHFDIMQVPRHPYAGAQQREMTETINRTFKDLFERHVIEVDDIRFEGVYDNDRAHYSANSAEQVVARICETIPAHYLN